MCRLRLSSHSQTPSISRSVPVHQSSRKWGYTNRNMQNPVTETRKIYTYGVWNPASSSCMIALTYDVTCKQAAFSPLSDGDYDCKYFYWFRASLQLLWRDLLLQSCFCLTREMLPPCPAQSQSSRICAEYKEGISSSRIDIMVAWFVFMLGDEAESILSYLDHDCILHQLSTNICLRTSWKIMIHACNPLV